LTPEQEEARIEQTAMALEVNARQQSQLEDEAAALAAHGDYVLNQVRAAKELRRYIDGESLWLYVREILRQGYPGCRWTQMGASPLEVDVCLSQEAKVDLQHYLEGHREVARTRLARSTLNELTRCVFSNRVDFGVSRYEVINQHHALVRFAASRLDPSTIFPVVAVQISADTVVPVAPGIYIVVAQRWSTTGARTIERLVYRAREVRSTRPLEADDAERLLVTAAVCADDWFEARQNVELSAVESAFDVTCADLDDDFERYAQRMHVENEADVDFQLDAVRRRTQSEIATIEEVNEGLRREGRLTMIPANEGRIRRLRDFLASREAVLSAKRRIATEPRDVMTSLVLVSA